MYNIREASSVDREAILNIRPDAYDGQDYLPAYIDHFFNSEDRKCLVCECNEELITMYNIREASSVDREAILNIRPDAYDGQDYLPAYIDHFFNSEDRKCLVCECNEELVGIVVLFFVDGGESCVLQCARVRSDFEGKGVYSLMSKTGERIAKEHGARYALVGNNSTLKMYKKQLEKGNSVIQHLEMTSQIVGPKNYETLSKLPCYNLQKISGKGVAGFFKDPKISEYLFKNGRFVVDWIPFKTIEENSRLLDGAFTEYFSDVRVQGQEIGGLLSAWTRYDVPNPHQMHLIDFFGADIKSVERHVHHYLKVNSERFKTLTCSLIFHTQYPDVQKEYLRVLKSAEVEPNIWSEDLGEAGEFCLTYFQKEL